jgi:hypothetical protein
MRMWMRHAIVLFGLLGFASDASAQNFRIDDVPSAVGMELAQLKPGTIAFSDHGAGNVAEADSYLMHFEDWASRYPNQRKFLTPFPGYVEPAAAATKPATKDDDPSTGKLYMYVAQARFILDRAAASIDLSRYVTLAFLEKIDPSIKHSLITAADVAPYRPENLANDNPDRKWCTELAVSICIRSIYKLEGKIPIGILLVNKIRDNVKKIADHIDFQSEFSALPPTAVDQPGLQQLTHLDTPVAGALEQNIFYVNELMRFGKFLAVFQSDPGDPNKTVVTAFMVLAIDAGVLDKKREYENVPVIRNLIPAQVLMGQSSFNSGDSISGGLPKYSRNEIAMVAGILAKDSAAK